MALTATTGFSINSVFWLRSLSDSEQGPTRRVLEDLEPFFAQIGVPFQLRDVKTPGELYAALQSLANSMVKPIVQLDMHGTREGLVFVGSGEVAPWREVVPRLRAINVASGANLCVVACLLCYLGGVDNTGIASQRSHSSRHRSTDRQAGGRPRRLLQVVVYRWQHLSRV